ncbi:hypothetical protein ACET3Z_019862 [Daucus carota]
MTPTLCRLCVLDKVKGNAEGSFVQWPKELVNLGQDPVSLEKKKEFLVANKDKRFIFAPYIQDDHWMLLMFSLEESVIYVFDSLRRERDIRLTTPARTAFKLYVPQGGRKNNRKEFLWYHTEVQCPQQLGGTECGFFIMRVLVQGGIRRKKLMRFKSCGLNFLPLNVYNQMDSL